MSATPPTDLAIYQARLWANVNKASGVFREVRGEMSECWEWTAGLNGKGYAYFWFNGQTLQAYKLAFLWSGGVIPDGLELDHVCRNRICVRPDHLEPVTRRENQLRSPLTVGGANARKIECPKGHPLSGENLYITKAGGRTCRICIYVKSTKWRSENIDKANASAREYMRRKREENKRRAV